MKTGPSVDTPSAVLAGDLSFSEPCVVQGSPFSAFHSLGDIQALTEQVEGLMSSLKEVSCNVSALWSFESVEAKPDLVFSIWSKGFSNPTEIFAPYLNMVFS